MLKASYQISVVNDTTQATPTNFQQLIQTTLQYPSGVRFWSPTDGWLYAWLESLSSTNQAVIWVKIPSSISANGVYQIYMVEDSSLNFDGNYWGEAPQLSSSYGQYDNGGNVFSNYWNFAGTSLPSSLTEEGTTSNITINNGITFSGSSDALVRSTNAISYPQITESLIQTSASTDYPTAVIGEGTTTTLLDNEYGWLQNGYAWDYYGGAWRLEYVTTNNARGIVGAVTANMVAGDVYSIVWVAVGNEKTYINYTSQVNSTDTTISSIGNYYAYLGFDTSGSSSYTAQWLRTRAYPPNGMMPETAIVPLQAWNVYLP